MTFKKRLRTNAIQNIWRVFPKIIDKIYKRELVCFVEQMFFCGRIYGPKIKTANEKRTTEAIAISKKDV